MKPLALLLAITAFACHAQNFPAKPLKFIVGVPPGGPTDAIARSIAPELGDALGQPVIVENRSGASGVIGTDSVAKSPADGYTLAFVFITHATNPTLVAKLPYDTLSDFAAVSLVGSQPMLLVANPALPASSVRELIALAKTSPGKLDYAASDPGSAPYLAGELFKFMSGTVITAVPYKGTAPALTDTLSGQVPFMFASMITVLPHVQAGKLRALAVTAPQRSALAPAVPTVAESGLPGFEINPWYGVVAPARTPRPVIDRLSGEIARITRKPDVRSRLAKQGVELAGSTPQEFDSHIRSEIVKWEKVLRAAGLGAGKP